MLRFVTLNCEYAFASSLGDDTYIECTKPVMKGTQVAEPPRPRIPGKDGGISSIQTVPASPFDSKYDYRVAVIKSAA